VLGFLSLLTFLFVQVGAQTGNPISVRIFGESEGELLPEQIEWIHMTIFAILVIFIIQVILLIRLGEREKCRWIKAEETAKFHRDGRRYLWKILPFLNPASRMEDDFNYFSIRREFINPRDPTHSSLPPDFDLSKYLSICMGHVLAEIVEITPRTWLCLEVFFLGVYLVSFTPYFFFVTFFCLFGYILLAWIFTISFRMTRIRNKLVPRVKVRSSVNEMTGLLEPKEFNDPLYLSERLYRRSTLGKIILGPPANKHERLFLFDSKGPQLIIFEIRLIVLLSAIYISTVVLISIT
jgi:hypothetical protein